MAGAGLDDRYAAPDTITAYGLAQIGDYPTTDLFDQIYNACKLLHRRTTCSSPSYNHRPYGYVSDAAWPGVGRTATRWKHIGPISGGTPEEAKANAVAAWNSSEWSSVSGNHPIYANNEWCTYAYLTRCQAMLYADFAEPGINEGKRVDVEVYAIGARNDWDEENPEEEPMAGAPKAPPRWPASSSNDSGTVRHGRTTGRRNSASKGKSSGSCKRSNRLLHFRDGNHLFGFSMFEKGLFHTTITLCE